MEGENALGQLLVNGEPVVRQVARVLRDAIVSMRLAPGDKLSEHSVARQLGVSRQPVREALIRLAETGLVRVLPQRGTLVEPLSVADVLDAHFIREAIECAVAREAAARADAAVLRGLRNSMADQRRAARAGDGPAFFAHDEAFHRLLAEAAGRLAAWRVVEEVKPRLDRVRYVNMAARERRALVLRQHAAVVQALADGNGDAAAAAMRAHLANVPDSLPGLVAQRPDLFADGRSPAAAARLPPAPDTLERSHKGSAQADRRTSMRKSTRAAVLASVLVPALAAGGAAAQTAGRAEVIHWWTSGGESAALKVYADAFKAAGGTWVDNAVAGGANARTAAINRTVGGDPPTAMQFNTGKQFDDLVENDLLSNVDAIAKSEDWAKTIPPAIVAAVTRNGHAYAMPVDIHGQNWFFFSKAALDKAGAQQPTNWTELFAALDKLKAAGLIPLAFSGQKTWERGLFNTTLAGFGSGDMFTRFWGKRDAAMVKGPEFRRVAETFRRLHDYVDPGSPGRNWNDATAFVIQGKAGMQVMGDWAKGEFTAAGQTAGKEYGCAVLSDHGPAYAIGGDVFAFPVIKNPAVQQTQQVLERVFTDPANQVAFSAKKGSVPARLDADISSLDECAHKAEGFLKDPAAQVPANELLAPPALSGAVEDLVSQYWNDTSMTTDTFIAKVAAALQASY